MLPLFFVPGKGIESKGQGRKENIIRIPMIISRLPHTLCKQSPLIKGAPIGRVRLSFPDGR